MEYKTVEKGIFNGINVVEYSMKNEELEVRFLNLGGAITKIALASDDYSENLVLAYENIESYFDNGCYLNTIIGRTSNRIKNGIFELNGQTINVDLNNGPNNLHGGAQCLTYANFDVIEIPSGYALTTTLPHQENGFPGNLSVKVCYLLDKNNFKVTYEATTDQDTIVNLTQHAYFNLSGNLKENIYNHELQIKADYVAEVDENLSFTTQLVPVKGTLFAFNQPTIVNHKSKEVLPLFEHTSGYDHLYLLSDIDHAVVFKHLDSNRTLKVSTSSPSMQFYAGNFLTPDLTFENGRMGENHLGACFETHLVPFDFESQVLKPGEIYTQETTFTFTK